MLQCQKNKRFFGIESKIKLRSMWLHKKKSALPHLKREKKKLSVLCAKKNYKKKICGMKNNENVFATILSLNTCLMVVLQPRLDLKFSWNSSFAFLLQIISVEIDKSFFLLQKKKDLTATTNECQRQNSTVCFSFLCSSRTAVNLL